MFACEFYDWHGGWKEKGRRDWEEGKGSTFKHQSVERLKERDASRRPLGTVSQVAYEVRVHKTIFVSNVTESRLGSTNQNYYRSPTCEKLV
jgi:hypothetical protein